MEIKLAFILVILNISDTLANEDVLVEISNGKVQGFLDKSYKNRVFSSFEGIPYARPPIGELRFEPPKEPQNWTGILIANTRHRCLQLPQGPLANLISSGSEDCLYLNVYVPRQNPTSSDNLPVIVHIHGAGFMAGAGHIYAGPKFLMDEDIILITINYRLGPFGFLSTEDKVVPGNNGLKDQVSSLKWIQKNIKYFGGNPNAVTITGMCSGGVSVHFHYFSSLSKGLFHRGFSEGGNALSPWALQENAFEKTKRLAKAVGCPSEISSEIIACLKTKSAEDIIEKNAMFRAVKGIPLVPLGPVVEIENEEAFITDWPYKMLVEKKVADLPWVDAVSEQEGYFFALWFSNNMKDFLENFDKIAPHLLEYNFTIDQNRMVDVTQKIMKHYFPHTNNLDGAGKVIGDRLFLRDAAIAAKLQALANRSPVHFMLFGYKGENSLCNLIVKNNCEKIGASRGDGTIYYLNAPNVSPLRLSEDDEKVKDFYVGWLTNLAKTGEAKISGVEWEPVKGGEPLECLSVKGPNDIKMGYIKDFGSNSFWKEIPFKENENLLK